MDKITLTINGLKITANKGKSVLESALENGIYIPIFAIIRRWKVVEPADFA